MNNVIQYAALLSAVGCKLDFNTTNATLEVTDYPQGKAKLIKAALADIEKFDDTANFVDGISAPFLADTISGNKNYLADYRKEILEKLGVMRNGKFISQELALIKTNRSWHTSETSNGCSHFGEVCTHRGMVHVPGKRGRKSNRKPTDYHLKNSQGTIGREQLVTPALEQLYKAIPDEMLISNAGHTIEINLTRYKNMDNEEFKSLLNKKLVELEALKEMANARE
jgi:hypothetical protein